MEDFEVLLMALGHHLSEEEISACFRDITSGDSVSFELFFEWWTDSMGVSAISKKSSSNRK